MNRQIERFLLVATSAGLPFLAVAAPTDIHNEPLTNAVSAPAPNIMFIFDDSGSMMFQHSPDYVTDVSMFNSNGTVRRDADSPMCFDYKDDDDTITTTPANGTVANARLKTCSLGDPPLMSAQFNKQYYDPAIRYYPAVNHDGSERISMTAANTANWTQVPTDAYGIQNSSQIETERSYTNTAGATTTNLVTGYPDRLWCTDRSATAASTDDATGTKTGTPNAPLCVKNSAYTHPSDTYGYGRNAGTTTTKFIYGAPYYYTIPITEYCTTANLRECVDANEDGTNPSPDTHAFPARVRWCSNSGTTTNGVNTFSDCQGKRTGSYLYPKTFGRVASGAGSVAAKARATLAIGTGQNNVVYTVTAISVDGVNLIGAPISASSGLDTSTKRSALAQAIATAITASSGSTGYTAMRNNQTVIVEATTTGSAANGKALLVSADLVITAAATAQMSITAVSSGSNITNLTANGTTPLIGGTVSCNYSNSSNNRSNCAANLTAAINNYTATSGYSATRSSATVTVRAPLALGSTPNGWPLRETGSVNTTADDTPAPTFSGGTAHVLPYTVTAFTGGSDFQAGSPRIGVAPFSRIDLVNDGRTFPQSRERTDCGVKGYCTYDEEMTNFANWYAYYRTRMQMMKTSSGRAFAALPETYRIGFITIAPGSTVSSSRYLKIDDFLPGENKHRSHWYDKLYAQTRQTTGTPLREALSRVGQLYAGKFGAGYLTNGIPEADDPIQLSCQSNFAILSSDGYWNGNGGRDIENNTLGDIDGIEDANYSRTQDGVYDKLKSANTLADAALYYYKTDLRPGAEMENNVRPSSRSSAQHQHMITFTLGLGLDGTLTYDRNYENQQSGDFVSIKQGNLNWPKPAAEEPSALDDLWHAAVNGRGRFFSASDPQELALGLADTLTSLGSMTGAGAAAATSNMQPVSGDNYAFTAEYRTNEWSGDLKARTIDLNNGIVSQVPLWSARELLDRRAWETRRIYTWDAGDSAGNRMKSFCWPGSIDVVCNDGDGLSADEQAHFNPTLLVQYPSRTDAQKAAMSAQKLVDYVRGERSNEMPGTSETTDLFRERVSVLGDFVSAQPKYLKGAEFSYRDPHYAAFKTCTKGYSGPEAGQPSCDASRFPHYPKARRGTVFAAANDGMLHAFETDVNDQPYYQTGGVSTPETADDTFTGNNTGNGEERWAYIPGMILPRLAKLAESPYTHRYFVDGSPQIGDICTGSCTSANDWRSILVGGLNAGGRGYYALDVTNPENPKALWEFTVSETCLSDEEASSGNHDADCHLGYTYGNPLITKRKSDGKWVVIVASGYNNFNPGDGKGYLYILDAWSGRILRRIGTGAGSAGVAADHSDANPAGLAKIAGWADNAALDYTTLAVYGADLLGNLWKFELDDTRDGYLGASRIATLKDADGNAQPVTTRPRLATANGYRAIYLATGKYLGLGDPGNSAQQTVYAIRDDLSGTTVNARSDTVSRTLGSGAFENTRRITDTSTVNWTTQKGWHVDLPDSGERVNVDPEMSSGTLVVASNVPHDSVCTSGGYSYLNFFNYLDGSSFLVEGSLLSSLRIANAMIVGINIVTLPGGKKKVVITTSSNQQITTDLPTVSAAFSGRRVLWRELVDER